MACSNGVCSLGGNMAKSNVPASNSTNISGLKNPSFFRGTPNQILQANRYSEPQQNILNQLLQLASQKLGQNLNQPTAQYPNPQSLARFNQPFNFAPIEKQARLGFERETVPSIAERFTSMGNNALSSGAFTSQLGQAGASLDHSLAALKGNIGREDLSRQQNLAERLYGLQFGRAENAEQNRLGLLQNLLGAGLTQQNENTFIPAQQSGLYNLLPGLIRAGGHGLAAYFTGGASLPRSIASEASNFTSGDPSRAAMGQSMFPVQGGFGGLTGLASTANYGLPNQAGRGFSGSSLYPGLTNLNRPF